MSVVLQKFATQADPKVLEEVRSIAAKEGKQLQAVVDEALRDFIEKKRRGSPRPEVMAAFGRSLVQFDELYKALAK